MGHAQLRVSCRAGRQELPLHQPPARIGGRMKRLCENGCGLPVESGDLSHGDTDTCFAALHDEIDRLKREIRRLKRLAKGKPRKEGA